MKAALRRACIALLASVAFASPIAAAPAMWRASDEDSQVWLFGSVHAFSSRVNWRTASFNKALRAADFVYFETPTSVDDAEYLGALVELGHADGRRTLSSYLDRQQRASLEAAAGRLGLNRVVLETMRPWFAAMTISGIVGDVAGVKMRPGVEDTLKREIPRRKERGLDTFETQLRVLADLSDGAQVQMLMEALDGETGSEPVDLTSAWLEGDVEGLYGPAAAAFGRPGSELFDALLTKRNRRWAGQIERLLATEHDVMVIVGAAHFGGSNGLPQLLARRGLKVERVQ